MLTNKIKKAINDHAAQCYPRESCGVIVKSTYIPCENIAADADQFEISPRDLINAERKGAIRAYVHSHPDGTNLPSVPDRVQMALHGLPWVITDGSEVQEYAPTDFSAPLLGREYYHGLLDCYTLVRDYYLRELGIELKDYPRRDTWWEDKDNPPLYLDNFTKEGFTEVSDIRKHDVILCRLGRTEHVNHALVFIGTGELQSETVDTAVGDSLVLHHPYNRPSVREMYGEQWQRRTALIIRHKDLM